VKSWEAGFQGRRRQRGFDAGLSEAGLFGGELGVRPEICEQKHSEHVYAAHSTTQIRDLSIPRAEQAFTRAFPSAELIVPVLEYSQFFSAAAFRDVVVIRSQALTRITCAVRATVE
jgi:hypothetical protein